MSDEMRLADERARRFIRRRLLRRAVWTGLGSLTTVVPIAIFGLLASRAYQRGDTVAVVWAVVGAVLLMAASLISYSRD